MPSIRRLVHSEGSLFDLSVGEAPQPLLEEDKRGGQMDRNEETSQKWMKEEEEEEYPCMFDSETLSDHITGKNSFSSSTDQLRFKLEADYWSLLSARLLEVGSGSSLCFVPPPPPVCAATSAPPLVAPGTTHCEDCLLLHHLGLCEGGRGPASVDCLSASCCSTCLSV